MTGLVLITEPTEEPVTLAEAKGHLRVTEDDDDGLIDGYIVAARQWAEDFVRRAFVTQTWDWTLDRFVPCFRVPKAPLVSVEHIKYIDTAGVEQTLASSEYTVDTKSEPARIVEAYAKSWPSTRGHINDVTLRVVVGYGAANAVPQIYKHAMLLVIAELYARRETAISGTIITEVPMSAKYLLWPHRIPAF